MASAIRWFEVHPAAKWGMGVGLVTCVAALAVPFEIKMVFFVASLVASAFGFRDQMTKPHFRLHGYETVADENDSGPHPFTVGLGLGTAPIWVVMMLYAFWNWFGWKFLAAIAVVLLLVVFNEKIREVWYALTDRIAERWYGSKAQEYFLEHQAGVCFFSGMTILIISVGVLCTSPPENWMRMLFCVVGLIFGAVIAFIGVGIKSVENN